MNNITIIEIYFIILVTLFLSQYKLYYTNVNVIYLILLYLYIKLIQ